MLGLRDTIYYKALPFFLRVMEKFETAEYERQKKIIAHNTVKSGKNRLFLTHGRGGGVDKFVETAAALVEAEGNIAWILLFNPIKRRFTLSRTRIHSGEQLTFKFPSQYKQMLLHLQTLGIAKFHIHHIRYLPLCFIDDLPELANRISQTYDYMMHDFIAFCPRIHLIDGNFHYCGMPEDARKCNNCIKQNGSLTSSPQDTLKWRQTCTRLLQQADEIIAPSHDTAERHKHILGDMAIKVIPHDSPAVNPQKFSAIAEGDLYVVAVIGRIHRHKGADILLACANDARQRNLPLRFTIIGDSSYARKLRSAGVTITGIFKEHELPGLLEASKASLVFLPSVWPETYSYVLSQAWQNSYFPVAFDLGAPAERIKSSNNGIVLPFDMINYPGLINDALLGAAREQHKP